ncbi:MAG: helix-turn-helix domain-containing protein [Cyclobacteriaceae bacterium]
MTTKNSYIAANIRRIRKDRQYSQKQLAELMNVRGNTISNIEKEVHGATIDFLVKFCEVTNASLDEITGITTITESVQIDSSLGEIIDYIQNNTNSFIEKSIVNRLLIELENKLKEVEKLKVDLERTNKLLDKLIP